MTCPPTVLALLLLACSGGDEPAAAPAEPVVIGDELGWVKEVATSPDEWTKTERAAPAGWAAFREHDYRTAYNAFDAAVQTDAGNKDAVVGRGRAALALSIVYQDMVDTSEPLFESFYSARVRNGEKFDGTDVPLVPALASHCRSGETAASWAHRVGSGPDLPLAVAITQNRPALEVGSAGPFGRRAAAHRLAKNEGSIDALMAAAQQPVLVVTEKDKTEKAHWDPCVWATLSEVWLARAMQNLATADGTPLDEIPLRMERGQWRGMEGLVAPTAGLATRIFAAWPSTADLRAELAATGEPAMLGAKAPSLRPIGIGTVAMADDDPDLARAEVQRLDAALGQGRHAVDELPEGDQGAAYVNELHLLDVYREEQLLVRARAAIHAGNPQQGLAYLSLAAETMGTNLDPTFHTLRALADVKLGHAADAAASLQPLVGRYPEVTGLIETANQYAALQPAAQPTAAVSAAP